MKQEERLKGLKGISIKNILVLQGVILIYTLSGVFGKMAAGNPFLSLHFVMFYVFEIGVLGVYAILWQQMIKKFSLSIAYANRAMAILWSMIWAAVIFQERITVKNIIGVVIVIIGTMIVNSDER